MADWKGVRKGEYEAGGREDRKESSKVHRNVRSRSSTLGSDSELKHSAHTKRKKRESSRSRFKRKRRRSSSSLSDDMEDERQARVRSKEWKKVKRDCNSSESSDECTRGHITSTIRSERSSERLKRKHKKRKRKCSSPSSDSSSDSDSSASYSSDSSDRQKRRKKHSKREKHSHRLHKKGKKHNLKSKRKKSSKTDSGRVVSYAAAGIEGPHPLPANPKQQDPSAIQSVVPISGINVKMRGPMTKEEWEKQQSVVRRVYDPDTGRHRLVKGDGEIIEEIVSREQQKAINKQATLGDGLSFRAGLSRLL